MNETKPGEPLADAPRKAGAIRRIRIDRPACIGARSCVLVSDKIFAMDDENLAFIVNPDADEDDNLKLAAQSCPVLAIYLYGEGGQQLFPEVS
jgi:ferredoxin